MKHKGIADDSRD